MRTDIVATLLVVGIGCGGSLAPGPSGDPDGAPNLDPTTSLSALSAPGLQTLCDWTAAQEGGYGAIIDCDAAATSLEAAQDQATCVAQAQSQFDQASCAATVSDWVTCTQWRLSNWCSANPPPPTGRCEALQTGCYP
ncbi:MAG: hypothetical protein ABTD50_07465 [Polyangiaceae bacterium]